MKAIIIGLVLSALMLSFSILIFTEQLYIRPFQGTSMMPTLTEGQYVVLTKINMPSNLTGYILGYRYDPSTHLLPFDSNATEINVLHRCISDNGTHLLMQGDNPITNTYPEGWIPKSWVEGYLIYTIELHW